jgi:hypothetical protein
LGAERIKTENVKMPGYKKLKAAAHNTLDSFLSSMNYVDDEYIDFELKRVVVNAKAELATLDFLDFEKSDALVKTSRVRKSFGFYNQMLQKQIEMQGSSIKQITELKLLVLQNKSGVYFEGRLTDDRGRAFTIKLNR